MKNELIFQDDELLFLDDEIDDSQVTSSEKEYWTVLIVDDEPEVHSVTKMVLRDVEFEGKALQFISAFTGQEALSILEQENDISIILLDVVMEHDHSGLEVVKTIRHQYMNEDVRIILRTGQPGQAPERTVITEYDINDYKEKTELTVQKLYTTVIASLRTYRDLKKIKALHSEMEMIQREIIFTLGEITETRSQETSFHVKRVAEYSKLLAKLAGLSEEEAEIIRLAATMHDVGKIAIPDAILNKPAKLTNDEFEEMKAHTTIGYNMLKSSQQTIIKSASIISLQHHEKYNGNGYPLRLAGEDIHIYARIVAIADVFDALGSERVYKKAWELERILDLFKEERGQHFDPLLIDLFIAHLDEFLEIRDSYSELSEIRIG